jgi:hypothetical protein
MLCSIGLYSMKLVTTYEKVRMCSFIISCRKESARGQVVDNWKWRMVARREQ